MRVGGSVRYSRFLLHFHRDCAASILCRVEYLPRLTGVAEHLDDALGEGVAPIRFGTWMGGDRDGNPYVTAPVMALAVEMQATEAFRHHLQAVFDLSRDLSISAKTEAGPMAMPPRRPSMNGSSPRARRTGARNTSMRSSR